MKACITLAIGSSCIYADSSAAAFDEQVKLQGPIAVLLVKCMPDQCMGADRIFRHTRQRLIRWACAHLAMVDGQECHAMARLLHHRRPACCGCPVSGSRASTARGQKPC